MVVEFQSVRLALKGTEILAGITFALKEGEVFGFIGPNGSGKTTTVRLMLGVYAPASGEVRVLGENPLRASAATCSRVGVILDQTGLYENLTAAEYLQFFGTCFRMFPSEAATRSREVLELVGLSDRKDAMLKTFSKGLRQRVALARSLLNRPRFMILDEPFDGLDFEFRRFILDLLPGLAKNEGTSIFVTSHNLAEIQQISDRVALLNRGRIVALGDSVSLCAQAAQHRSLVIALSQDYPTEWIMQLVPDASYCREKRLLSLALPILKESQDDLILRLLKSGVSVSSVVQQSPSLEDVYLQLTRE